MNTAVNARSPTGITLTKEQKDSRIRQGYWDHAIQYSLDYYIAGRFAIAHQFAPVGANILHHAVELLLKACLAQDDTLEKILEYGHKKRGYDHNIVRLWQEFKERRGAAAEFDAVIKGLHAFEEIRYPETLIRDGATISIDIFDAENPVAGDDQMPEKTYKLTLPQIDRLMGLLFDASGANPQAYLRRVTDDAHALRYYDMVRPTLFGRVASQSG